MKITIRHAGPAEMHVHVHDMDHPREASALQPHLAAIPAAEQHLVVTGIPSHDPANGKHALTLELKTARINVGEVDRFHRHRHALQAAFKAAGHDSTMENEPPAAPAVKTSQTVTEDASPPLPSAPDRAHNPEQPPTTQ